MKLLIVSHPCVTPVNQQLFIEVERMTGWDITLVGPSNWVDDYGTVRSLTPAPGFAGQTHAIPVWPPASIPLHVYRSTFFPLLRAEQPDAIYVHNEPYAASTAQVLAANKMSGVNAAFGFYSAQNIEKSYPPPFSWTERWVYGNSSFAFPCSESVTDTLRAKGYTGSATRLPLGIDPELYSAQDDDRALRQDLVGDASVLIGYIGRLTEEKGLFTLLEALERLPADLDWKLAVVGTGSDEAALKQRADALGFADRINWVGYVEHTTAPRYLSAFDMLVVPSETQPSWKEQFGRVIVEALSCGTPVVGSDSGEIPLLLSRTGGGHVVRERDPRDLADGIERLGRDASLRASLAATGAEYVRSNLDHETLAATFASAIEQTQSAPTRTGAPPITA